MQSNQSCSNNNTPFHSGPASRPSVYWGIVDTRERQGPRLEKIMLIYSKIHGVNVRVCPRAARWRSEVNGRPSGALPLSPHWERARQSAIRLPSLDKPKNSPTPCPRGYFNHKHLGFWLQTLSQTVHSKLFHAPQMKAKSTQSKHQKGHLMKSVLYITIHPNSHYHCYKESEED